MHLITYCVPRRRLLSGLAGIVLALSLPERTLPQERRILIVSANAAPVTTQATHPLRKVRLINGDEVTAEILAGDRGFIQLRLFGDLRLRVPLWTIDSLSSLPGERELLNENLSDAALTHGGKQTESPPMPVVIPLPMVSANCRGWFRFRFRAEELSAFAGTGWTWRFAADGRLRIHLDPDGRWRTTAENLPATPVTRQSVAAGSGWQIARLLVLDGRLFASVDEQLLYSGPVPDGSLEALEFFTANAEQGGPFPLQVDHFALVERHSSTPILLPELPRTADELIGSAGEIWWGDLQTLGPQGVFWTNQLSQWQRTWSQLQGVALRSPAKPLPGRPVHGRIVRLELQPSTDRPDLAGDHVVVALGADESGRLAVEHPLWGRFAVPSAAIRNVESLLLGEWRLLDAREIALGSSTARHATDIAGTFSFDDQPWGAVYLALEAAELDPSGPHTPPGSPTLNALRAGRYVTELHVNNQRVGTFNELTSQWSLPGRFDRLRMRLPVHLLQRGENTWRISQTAGDGTLHSFDQCRLRSISLEIEAITVTRRASEGVRSK